MATGQVFFCKNHPPAGYFVSGRGIDIMGDVGPAPSLREPGWGCTIQRVARKAEGGGRFSSPLRNSECFTFYHSTDDTPSVTPLRACQLPQGGSRGGLYHSTGCSLKSGGTGDFRRPYGGSEGITLYHGKSPGRRGSGDWGVSLGLSLRWTGPIPRGFWGRRR